MIEDIDWLNIVDAVRRCCRDILTEARDAYPDEVRAIIENGDFPSAQNYGDHLTDLYRERVIVSLEAEYGPQSPDEADSAWAMFVYLMFGEQDLANRPVPEEIPAGAKVALVEYSLHGGLFVTIEGTSHHVDSPEEDDTGAAEMAALRALLESKGVTYVANDEDTRPVPLERFFERHGHPLGENSSFETSVREVVKTINIGDRLLLKSESIELSPGNTFQNDLEYLVKFKPSADHLVLEYDGAMNADPGNMVVLERCVMSTTEIAWWYAGEAYKATRDGNGSTRHDWVLEKFNWIEDTTSTVTE